MIIVLAVLVTLYFVSAMLILWWTVTVTRQHRNEDLRWHREVLMKEIKTELLVHESRLSERLKRAR